MLAEIVLKDVRDNLLREDLTYKGCNDRSVIELCSV